MKNKNKKKIKIKKIKKIKKGKIYGQKKQPKVERKR